MNESLERLGDYIEKIKHSYSRARAFAHFRDLELLVKHYEKISPSRESYAISAGYTVNQNIAIGHSAGEAIKRDPETELEKICSSIRRSREENEVRLTLHLVQLWIEEAEK